MKHLTGSNWHHPLLAVAWLAASTAFAAQPVNDNFTDLIVLSGARVTTNGTNVGATREQGEPDLVLGNSPTRTRTVWWSWTAPSEGLLVVSVIGSDFSAAVDVLTGEAVNELRLVSNCQWTLSWCDTARVRVSAGVPYQIVVAGNSGDIEGNILLNLAFFERPPNDDFADRIHLGSGNVSAIGTNTAATLEPGEEWPSLYVLGRSLWWSWTAPASGPVTMGVEGSPFNPDALTFGEYPGARPVLSIFVGENVGTAIPITNRLSPEFLNAPSLSQVTFDALAGTTYQIAADGGLNLFSALTLRIARTEPPLVLLTSPLNDAEFVTGAPVTVTAEALDPDGTISAVEFFLYDPYGDEDGTYRDVARPFTSRWTNLPPGEYEVSARATDNLGATAEAIPIQFNVRPVNDVFARRIAFAGASVTVAGTLENASLEPGEPPATGSASVWWSWTAPASGTFTITADSAQALSVFTGGSLNDLILIASSTVAGFDAGYTRRVVIHAEAGEAYPIAVGGGRYGGGWCSLSVAQTVPPTVTITSPVPEARFTAGESVTFAVTVSDEDGSVRRVDYVLDDYRLLGSVTNSPFTLVHTFTQGSSRHRVRGWATDDAGVTTPSDLVWFEVHYPGPANDHFANRIAFTGSFVSVTGSTANATIEPGETELFNHGSAWWTWTAPESGTYTITVRSQAGYWPSLAVFTGANLASLDRITNSAFAGRDYSYETRVVVNAQAGVSFPIAVGGGGDMVLSVARTLPPAVTIISPTNDAVYVAGGTLDLVADASDPDGTIRQVEFYSNGSQLLGVVTNSPFVLPIGTRDFYGYNRVQAWAIDNRGVRTVSDEVHFQVRLRGPPNDDFADRISFSGSFVSITGATANATFEPGEELRVSDGSAWWAWTAPESANFTITATSMPGYWPSLAVFTGSTLAGLNLIASSAYRGDAPAYSTRIVLQAESGITYPIAAASRGDVTLSVTRAVPPSVMITSPVAEARFIVGEPVTFDARALDGDGIVRRVEFVLDDYYSLGVATNSPFTLVHTFREGFVRHRLRAWATDDAGLATPSKLVWFEVHFPPPPNDSFASRIHLSGTLVVVEGSLRNATREPSEPTPPPPFRGGSAWWSWTAPASGKVTLTSSAGSFLGVHTGNNIASLEAVEIDASSRWPAQLVFDAVAGIEYQIASVDSDNHYGPMQLALFLDARELRGPRMLREGLFAFDLRTTIERLWIIQASTNLVNWTPVAAGRCAGGRLEFLDPTAAGYPRRFYRAVSEP